MVRRDIEREIAGAKCLSRLEEMGSRAQMEVLALDERKHSSVVTGRKMAYRAERDASWWLCWDQLEVLC